MKVNNFSKNVRVTYNYYYGVLLRKALFHSCIYSYCCKCFRKLLFINLELDLQGCHKSRKKTFSFNLELQDALSRKQYYCHESLICFSGHKPEKLSL